MDGLGAAGTEPESLFGVEFGWSVVTTVVSGVREASGVISATDVSNGTSFAVGKSTVVSAPTVESEGLFNAWVLIAAAAVPVNRTAASAKAVPNFDLMPQN